MKCPDCGAEVDDVEIARGLDRQRVLVDPTLIPVADLRQFAIVPVTPRRIGDSDTRGVDLDTAALGISELGGDAAYVAAIHKCGSLPSIVDLEALSKRVGVSLTEYA